MPMNRYGNCELWHGDCTSILKTINNVDTVITDPIWPNNKVPEFVNINPYELFENAWKLINTKRAVIHLGCDSDPGILRPISLPFFRIAWLEYVKPGHKGRLLYTGDVAYLYGLPPEAIPGRKLISGKCVSKNNFGKEADHPCPRKLQHVKWLVWQFTNQDDIVLDPFMGSGTTGVACAELGRKFIGIEINEKYFNIACKRIEETFAQKTFNFGSVNHANPD